jgi:hypothetical protein
MQPFDQGRNRSAIIDIAWGQATSQQLASVIDCQVRLEAKEPAHACLPTSGIRSKDAVSTYPFWVTDLQRSRVNEADARAGSISALQVSEHRNQHAWKEGNKTLITHQMRKFAGEVYLDMLGVIRLKGPIVRLVKMVQNRHHLTWAELTRTRSLLASSQSASFPVRLKAQQEVIDITKQFE